MIAGGNHTSVSCREAAKGVSSVALSCSHSSNNTPSVSPYGLPAPPLGSQGPRCPLWGWCSAQRIKIVMIAGGNHTSVSCRAAAKGVPPVTLSCNHSSNNTPSVSLAGFEEPSSLPAPPPGSRGIVRIRSRFHKNAGAYCNPSAAAAAAQLCMKRLHPLNLSGALGDGIVPYGHDRGRSTIYHKNFRSIPAFFAVFPLYNRWGL